MINTLLETSLPLSVLLAALLLIQRTLVSQLGAVNLYALWLAVPVFLLVKLAAAVASHSGFQGTIDYFTVSLPAITVPEQLNGWLQSSFWLTSIWVTGMVVCITALGVSYMLSRVTFYRATPVSIRGFSGCRQAHDQSGPWITGFRSPKVLLPNDFFTRFDPTQQQLILQHELTHWRRGDLHLNYLALGLVSIFWFNPLVWLAYRYYRQAQELACDAVVTRNAGKSERIAYGYALLSNTQQSPQFWWPLTHHYGDFNTMKQRIIQLQRQHGFSKTILLSTMALVVAGTLLLQQPLLADGAKSAAPKPVMRIEPRYPIQAAQQSIDGYVQLKFDIDAHGKVSNVRVVKSSPEQVFDKEAIRALEQWTYSATGVTHKDQLVQLEFALDLEQYDLERVKVTPSVGKGSH
ncbi:TonB family protein [Alishewanella sp. d11]|uniref:TonB family protein n=1 Tax=Alishewanella sp. d11 TaxID=3414030 RepID=UPI003BF80221